MLSPNNKLAIILLSYCIVVNSNVIPAFKKNAEQGDLYEGDIKGIVRNFKVF